jgi:transposase
MMSSWLVGRRIWMYTEVVDFRKQLDGLVGIIGNEMGLKAEDGIYVFRNRSRDKIKMVLWDRNGFIMGYKRLERGRFDFPEEDDEIIKMDLSQLEMLISGMPMVRVGKREKMDLFLT